MVTKWYDESNLTLNEVKAKSYDYIKKFPKSKTDVRWDTFEVKPIGENYLATYKLVHTIKTKGKFYNKVYDISIKALWTKNLKIKSLYEIR